MTNEYAESIALHRIRVLEACENDKYIDTGVTTRHVGGGVLKR